MTTKKIIQVGQDDDGGQETMEIRDYSGKEWSHFVDHCRHHPDKPLLKRLLRNLEQGAVSLL